MFPYLIGPVAYPMYFALRLLSVQKLRYIYTFLVLQLKNYVRVSSRLQMVHFGLWGFCSLVGLLDKV